MSSFYVLETIMDQAKEKMRIIVIYETSSRSRFFLR